jgi:hypothetical protein
MTLPLEFILPHRENAVRPGNIAGSPWQTDRAGSPLDELEMGLIRAGFILTYPALVESRAITIYNGRGSDVDEKICRVLPAGFVLFGAPFLGVFVERLF